MRYGKAIAVVAVLGFGGLIATSMVHAGANCGSQSKASMQSGSGCSSQASKSGGAYPGQGTMSKAGGSCSGMSKADGCGTAKGASMECSMSPAECEQMMRTYYKTHGWLGIEMTYADGEITTPTVTKIAAGSPAEKAGFKVGDLLTSINGIGFDAKNAEALKGVMENGFKIGEVVRYTAKRDDQIVTLSPVLAAIPDASLKEMVAAHVTSTHKSKEKSS